MRKPLVKLIILKDRTRLRLKVSGFKSHLHEMMAYFMRFDKCRPLHFCHQLAIRRRQ